MRALVTLARTTLTQLRRERLLWSGLVVALLVAAFGLALAPLSLHQGNRIIVDLGLAAASIAGTLLAISATVQLVGGELHDQRALLLLSRQLPRHTWLGGRALGLGLAMGAVIACIGGTTALLCLGLGGTLPGAFAPALALTAVEVTVVTCVTLLFCAFTTRGLAATFSVGTVAAGHMSAELLALAPAGKLGIGWHVIYQLVPDMQRLSLRTQVAGEQPVAWTTFALQAGYGLSYACATLLVATVILARRRCI